MPQFTRLYKEYLAIDSVWDSSNGIMRTNNYHTIIAKLKCLHEHFCPGESITRSKQRMLEECYINQTHLNTEKCGIVDIMSLHDVTLLCMTQEV